ncbi:MAG: hypothetical protein R3F19_19340 [Verrucomicrobiales bacterium]
MKRFPLSDRLAKTSMCAVITLAAHTVHAAPGGNESLKPRIIVTSDGEI